ncbi:succinate dehydrogenase assembly factor 4, mitochondrial-like [Topomyia yanbarensis]|uniref:succinate dehydrogenase assembly factor 4, mitochondrial-like n=1 Tax=Topomyia yanbarensis TaxID=2498891 RepID=UPI00273BD15D|nr:succinate dehydrogenase assembly factor 4, mitochondrial-like [Topomyia yanbarensis]
MISRILATTTSFSSARNAYFVKIVTFSSKTPDKPISPRMEEFQKKLREKTPIGKLDELTGNHPYQEKEPLQSWPDNTNPNTGEVGGPRGPEPTRYGDWERKGRVSDF